MEIIDFPLYNELKKNSQSYIEVPDVWKYVMNLPLEHLEIIYALIWHHSLLEQPKLKNGSISISSQRKANIPYKGKLFDTGKGMIFQVKELPIELQKIIAYYISAVVHS